MQKDFKLLFIGDIVGRCGRNIVKKFLSENNKKSEYDFVIANVENASHGFGLTKKNYDELKACGIDCMTSGNHIWDKKDILTYIDEADILIRPYNYHKSVSGVGYRIFDNGMIVINLLGKTFMPPIDCPFVALEEIIQELKNKINIDDKIIFVDFHAEATAEKQCFARFAFDLGVSAVVGTHTHVQTADECILDGHAYLTDAGCCASKMGVIGMEYQPSLKRLMTSVNERFDVEMSAPYVFNACEIIFSENRAKSINRISFEYSILEEQDSEN